MGSNLDNFVVVASERSDDGVFQWTGAQVVSMEFASWDLACIWADRHCAGMDYVAITVAEAAANGVE